MFFTSAHLTKTNHEINLRSVVTTLHCQKEIHVGDSNQWLAQTQIKKAFQNHSLPMSPCSESAGSFLWAWRVEGSHVMRFGHFVIFKGISAKRGAKLEDHGKRLDASEK